MHTCDVQLRFKSMAHEVRDGKFQSRVFEYELGVMKALRKDSLSIQHHRGTIPQYPLNPPAPPSRSQPMEHFTDKQHTGDWTGMRELHGLEIEGKELHREERKGNGRRAKENRRRRRGEGKGESRAAKKGREKARK